MRVGACALGFGLAALAAAQEHLFYGGDFNGINGLACERNTQVPDARTYDDVIVRRPALVSDIWGNHVMQNLTSSRAYWELREGVVPGDGGRLVTFGEGAATATRQRFWPTSRPRSYACLKATGSTGASRRSGPATTTG